MRRKVHVRALLFLAAALAVFCAGSAFAVPEVSEQEPQASQELWGGLFSRIAGTDWDGLKNAVLEARRDGKTSVTVLLNEETFQEFTETQRLWYYAGQAGVMDAECSYRPGGRIWLNNIQWWPWPMYLVESREEFAQAVQQAESAHTFGMLLNETLYGELIGNDRERNRLECLSGLIDYSDMYYSDDHCAVWYMEPETAEVTPLEAEGVGGSVRVLQEALLGEPRGKIVLAVDDATYAALERDANLMDKVMSAAGLLCPYDAYDQAKVFVFPPAEEACYPGMRIAQAVRAGREKELSLQHRLILTDARLLVRNVSGTDLEKAKQIHDLLCSRITYTVDDATGNDDCCVGALLYGKANCDGYADAFYLCASLCDLEVRYISGDFKAEGEAQEDEDAGHMWNLILLDGSWRSVDVTWDDEEEYGVSYQYFNIGLDRMEAAYSFSREVLPEPFAEKTDRSWLSIRERSADTWEELSEAIVQSAEAGESQTVIRCSEEVLKRLSEAREEIYFLAASRGVMVNHAYRAGAELNLEGVTKLERWRFCETEEEVTQAALDLRDKKPREFWLTLTKDLFSKLIEQDDAESCFQLLIRGGVYTSGLSSWSEACLVHVREAEWYDGYYAENIRSVVRMTQAIREGLTEGHENFYLFLSKPLFMELMEDPSLLNRVVRDSGYPGSWSYDAWDEEYSIYIYSTGKTEK